MLRQNISCVIILSVIILKSVCSAQNDEDEVTTESNIVPENVTTVVFDKHLESIIKVAYGQHIKLVCDNTSSATEFKWQIKGKTLSTDKVLDIKSVTEKYHGVYITCTVQSKLNVLEVRGANILLSSLDPPIVSKQIPSKVTVTEKDNLTLDCLIVKSTPPPTINWQVKRYGANEFEDLTATGKELTIEVSRLKDNGLYKCTARNIKGEGHTLIDVTVQKSPVLNIEGPTNMTFDYGSTKEFICKVSGYPQPKVSWKDDKGNKLTSKDTEINWHEKISKLSVTMKKNKNYSCFAENIVGKADDSVKVNVRSPFIVHEYPRDTLGVHYAETTRILCNITSAFPMRIQWDSQRKQTDIKNNRRFLINTEMENDNRFSIDEGFLKIKSVDLDMVGLYKCEASLISDRNEKVSFITDLQIVNLAPPLLSETTQLAVMETADLTLTCYIIDGVPEPTLSWQVMRHGEKTYKNLKITTMELDLKNITIDDAGKYRCVSENAIGKSTGKVTELLVKKAPTTFITKESAVSVAYGSNLTYTCQVVGYPLSTVTWTDAAGTLLKAIEKIIINEHTVTSKIAVDVIRSANKFYCLATNSLGSSNTSIDVTVLSPFIIYETPKDITNVHNAAAADLVCNITASFPMTIEWYHNDTILKAFNDQMVLHINSMHLEDMGNYRCEVTLISDNSQKKKFSTEVKIDDLRAPVITFYNGENVAVKKFKELSLTCKAYGNPQPVVTWQYKSRTVGTGETIHVSDQQLGTYKCIAANVVGMDSKNIHVTLKP